MTSITPPSKPPSVTFSVLAISTRLDAARGNAIANLLRVRLDILVEHEVGEEIAELREEVRRLRAMVPRIGGR